MCFQGDFLLRTIAKSPCFTTIWENIFTSSKHLRQIQVTGCECLSISVSGSLYRWQYIPLIYHLYIANWMILTATYNLLREPGNSIEFSTFWPSRMFKFARFFLHSRQVSTMSSLMPKPWNWSNPYVGNPIEATFGASWKRAPAWRIIPGRT